MRHLGAAALAALALLPGTAGAASRVGTGHVALEAVIVFGYDAKAKANVVAAIAEYAVRGTSVTAAGPKDVAYAFRIVCLAFSTTKTNDSGCAVLAPGTPAVTGTVLPESGRIRTKVPSVRGWLQADLTVTATPDAAPYVLPTYGHGVTTLTVAGVPIPVGATVMAGPQVLRPGTVSGTFRTSRGLTLRPAAQGHPTYRTGLLRTESVSMGAFADRRDVLAALHAATVAALP